jgi:hypothetical protein
MKVVVLVPDAVSNATKNYPIPPFVHVHPAINQADHTRASRPLFNFRIVVIAQRKKNIAFCRFGNRLNPAPHHLVVPFAHLIAKIPSDCAKVVFQLHHLVDNPFHNSIRHIHVKVAYVQNAHALEGSWQVAKVPVMK